MKSIELFKFFVYSFLFIVAFMGTDYAVTLSGTVVDKENDNKPIPGVMVSAHHTIYRTITDEQGHFTLDAPLTDAVLMNSPLSLGLQKIGWDKQKLILDFSKAPGITAVSIFRINGSRVFHADIKAKNRLVHFPSIAQGVYFVKAVLADNSSYFWKWSAFDTRGNFSVPLLARHAMGKSASAGHETLLLFRHDDYYPYERRLSSAAENLMIEMKPDPRRVVFDPLKIHSYYFTITHEDSLWLEKHAFDEKYIPANFTFDSVAFGKVGLRYKGSKYYLLKDCFDSSGRVTSNSLCAKVAMKVKFDQYNDSARFYSLKRLNMHAMSDDPSKMHEMLCYKVFRDMGIYASRTAYMKLFINGSFQGLFLAVEELDGRFTKSRWPAFGDGNLFKETWPNRINPGYYKAALVTNNDAGDTANGKRMVAFSQAIKNSTKETFIQNVSPFMDLDYWLRYIVVDRAIHNADGIMTWYYDTASQWSGNHNFYFYEEENSGGKFWLLPWDLPATLTKTDPIIDDYGVPEWNVEPEACSPMPIWSGSFGLPPNCDKLTKLTAAALWDGFVSAGEQFLATCFHSDTLKRRVDHIATLIEPVIAQDPAIVLKKWQNEVKDLRTTMDILNKGFDDYIHGRIAVVDTSALATPFPDSGYLAADRINNFEFTAVAQPSFWTFDSISKGSTISLVLDTVAPLWGKSDLLCSFVFLPLDTPLMHAEWSDVRLFCKNETDCRNLKGLRMHLKCDSPRYYFVYLLSKSYERKGAKNFYGWSISIGVKNKQYTFDRDQIGYPTWSATDNPDILDTVLASVQGIGFSSEPRYNDQGEMAVVPDSGYMRVDNILFEY